MTTKTSSAWRQEYRVHPAADIFPMMSEASSTSSAPTSRQTGSI